MVRNPELEAALLRDPDDDAPYLVYADWLLERGNEHGRLITVQHALETSETDALREEEATLIARLFGEVDPTFDLQWRRGFVEELVIPYEGEPDAAGFLRRLFASPFGLLLGDLTVGIYAGYDIAQEIVTELVKARPPLTRLVLGDFASPTGDLNGISWLELGDVSRLWPALPRLRELVVQGQAELGELVLPELQLLELRSGNLSRAALRSVVRARCPKLEVLRIWFGDPNYGAECEVDDVVPLLSAKFPALRTLGLMNAAFADALPAVLAGSPLLAQVSALDLSMGVFAAEGAEQLLARREAFAHLRDLNLEQCLLRGAEIDRLREALPAARTIRQRNDAYGRYVAVGE